jgi:hypothetical protein
MSSSSKMNQKQQKQKAEQLEGGKKTFNSAFCMIEEIVRVLYYT